MRIKKCLFVVQFLIIYSCAAYQSLPMWSLKIGMSKEEVIQSLKRNPDNLIGAKKYSEGVLEVLQYSRLDHIYSSVVERYWLYFFNNKLVQWGRPGDWEREADRIYEVRNR